MVIDICSFAPLREFYRARLLGWAAIPGYLRMFRKSLARFCGVSEEEFSLRALNRPEGEVERFLEEVAERRARPLGEFIGELDAAGVERALLFSLDAETTLGAPRLPDEAVASVVSAHPERFIGFAGADPHKGKEAAEGFERAVGELGLRGLFLVPFWHRLRANDRRCYPLYQKCVELGVPAWVHTSVNWSPTHPMDFGRPLHLDYVAADFPGLKLIAGHGGWPWVGEMVAAAWRHENVHIDLSGHRPKYLAAPGSGWEMLMRFGGSVLQDKVLFGTDWPLMPVGLKELVEEARALPLREEVREKWLWGNAARLLGVG